MVRRGSGGRLTGASEFPRRSPGAALPAANDPDQQRSPENGKTGFLKFLELGWGNVAATSTWPGCGARRPAPGPGGAGEAGAPDEVVAGVCGGGSVQPAGLARR